MLETQSRGRIHWRNFAYYRIKESDHGNTNFYPRGPHGRLLGNSVLAGILGLEPTEMGIQEGWQISGKGI